MTFAPSPQFDPCDGTEPHVALAGDNPIGTAATPPTVEIVKPVHRRAAMAAQMPTEVAASVLNFAVDGPISDQFALEPEDLARLGEAFGIVLEIEAPATQRRHQAGDDPNGPASINQMQGALVRFSEEWS